MGDSIWRYKKVHMVGVKGVGMAALAEILLKNGFSLTGSDVFEEFMTDEVLARLGIRVEAFDPRNVSGREAVIRSNAYTEEHPEVQAAKDAGMPIFSYPEVVAELFNAHTGIAVAGSHGKTSTTAMLAHILKHAGADITAIVGSKVVNWKSGAIAGDLGDPNAPFVLEADEYKEAFLNYHPKGAIVTNIDWDHPDYFKTPDAYAEAFKKLIALIPREGFLVANGDDAVLSRVAEGASCKIIWVSEKSLEPLELRLPGAHYLFDANLAYRAALELGTEKSAAREALADFRGTARRMELVGEKNGTFVYDDYAHHPAEIRATLRALRQKYPAEKIIAVFQPHTFSRTNALFGDFARAFSDANIAVLADVYPSARERKELAEETDMKRMAALVRENGVEAVYLGNTAVLEYLMENTKGGKSVVVTLGAGDIWQIARQFARK